MPKDTEDGEADSVATGTAVPVPDRLAVNVGSVALEDTVRLAE